MCNNSVVNKTLITTTKHDLLSQSLEFTVPAPYTPFTLTVTERCFCAASFCSWSVVVWLNSMACACALPEAESLHAFKPSAHV